MVTGRLILGSSSTGVGGPFLGVEKGPLGASRCVPRVVIAL